MKPWFALAVILVPAVASAQPTDAEQQEAGALVEQANVTSQRGDHETAAQLYQQAYKLTRQPMLLSDIGSEYLLMQNRRWALTYFCRYLDAEPTGTNAATAKAQVRTLYVQLGGSATLNDEEQCKPIVKSGAVVKPPAVPLKQPLATAGDSGVAPAHTSDMSRVRLAGLGVAGLGVLAFAVGAYYGVEANRLQDELTNHPVDEPWPVDLRAREAQGDSYNNRAIILMTGGAVVAAAGAAAFLFIRSDPSASATETVMFTPIVSPDGFGLAAAGRF